MTFQNWDGTEVSGRFLGGCLDCLVNLCGTQYDRVKEFNEKYKEDGIIWFLEACDLNSVSVERALWELRNAGWFDTAKAFIFGRPAQYGNRSLGLNMAEACMREVHRVEARIGRLTGSTDYIPVVLDADLGHLPPQIPMISGGFGTMTGGTYTREASLRIRFERK